MGVIELTRKIKERGNGQFVLVAGEKVKLHIAGEKVLEYVCPEGVVAEVNVSFDITEVQS